MSKLDELVRRLLLSYPTLFSTRWDVLVHLYLTNGNGYEWVGGELVDNYSEPWDEKRVRMKFYDRCDAWEKKFGVDANSRLTRARYQFLLEWVDDLAVERRGSSSLSFERLISLSPDYCFAFSVPDDAEQSFRAGAVEVLRELLPLLAYASMQGMDNGVRDRVGEELLRLDGPATRAVQQLLADILKDD